MGVIPGLLSIVANLVLAAVLFYLLKGTEFVMEAGKGALIATFFGGTMSYVACYFASPGSEIACGIAGAIAAMWASFFTSFFS